MALQDMNSEEMGAHHCTRENISYTIAALKKIESGEDNIELQDWRTNCGTYALQMEWLLSHFDG